MAKKRQNGEGTIYQRPNGLWVCELTLGYDENNKRIKKVLTSMDREALQKKINDTKYLRDRNMVAEPSKHTVETWLNFWLENYKSHSVKPTTYDMYDNCCRSHLIPKFGKIKLDKLNTLQVQQYFNSLADELSISSIKKIYITLSQSYQMANKLNMIYHNPCNDVVLPKQEKTKAVAFTPQEQEAFLQTCTSGSTYDNLYVFAFNTGMRLGELQALTFDRIRNGHVIVDSNLQTVSDRDETSDKKLKQIITTTKTASSTRQIPLNAAALRAVRLQGQNNTTGSMFVFYSAAGTPLQKRNIYRNLDAKLQEIGANDNLTFHSIRHSFATRLLERGADIKTISELLGHRSIQITLDIYSHVSNDLKQKTIALLDAVM